MSENAGKLFKGRHKSMDGSCHTYELMVDVMYPTRRVIWPGDYYQYIYLLYSCLRKILLHYQAQPQTPVHQCWNRDEGRGGGGILYVADVSMAYS